jgi:hypothetical protein
MRLINWCHWRVVQIILAFICLFATSVGRPAYGSLKCSELLNSQGEYQIYQSWKNIRFSDVRYFNPKKYNLLVHAIRFTDQFHPEFFEKRARDLLDNPNSIGDQEWISTSLISEKKHMTYSMQGLILEIVPEHLFHTSPKDAWTQNQKGTVGVPGREKPNEILHPEALMNKTHPDRYNEVVLRGTVIVDGIAYRVRPVAFFVRTYGGMTYTRWHKEIAEAASKAGLPLVGVPIEQSY